MRIYNCELIEMVKDCIIDSLIKGDEIYKGKMPLIRQVGEYYIREIPKIIKSKLQKEKDILRTYEEILNSFEKLIIEIENPKYIYWFARDIRGYSTFELHEAIMKTKDPRYIYLYARDVKGALIRILECSIISTGNAQYIYLFSKYVKEANKDRLFEGLLQTGNLRYITDFLNQLIEESNLDEESVYKYLYERITAFG